MNHALQIKFVAEEPLSTQLVYDTFQLCFNKALAPGYWEWRFLNNPCYQTPQIAYVLDNGILAAYYAVSPVWMHQEASEPVLAALSMMTMTHPNYRGQGLFTKLAKALFSRLAEHNFQAVIGFANVNSHYGFRKYLGWQDIAAMYTLQARRDRWRSTSTSTVEACFQSKLTEDVLGSWTFLPSFTGAYHLARSSDFLRWRVLENPLNDYQGLLLHTKSEERLVIFKEYQGEIDILEVLGGGLQPELVAALAKAFFERPKHTHTCINLWSNLWSEEHLALEKNGFFPTSFNSFYGQISLKPELAKTDIRNWHLRFIDSDIF